jgi:hypothetical protein
VGVLEVKLQTVLASQIDGAFRAPGTLTPGIGRPVSARYEAGYIIKEPVLTRKRREKSLPLPLYSDFGQVLGQR